MDKIEAKITSAQLGALTGNGLVEVEADTRRNVRIRLQSDENRVLNKIATDEEGNEYGVLVFPEDKFDAVLESIGAETGQDKVQIGDMVWLRAT